MIPGVILAAGASTRMGRPKALLPIPGSGETFLSRLTGSLLDGGVSDVLVVIGPHGAEIQQAIQAWDTPPRVVVNPQSGRGQLSSLWVALSAVEHPGVTALLVALVDVPLVRSATIRTLVNAHERTRAPVVRPVSAGRHGHPVIFDRTLFPALRATALDAGAKAVVLAAGEAVLDVEVQDEGAFADIDTPEAYLQAFGCPIPG